MTRPNTQLHEWQYAPTFKAMNAFINTLAWDRMALTHSSLPTFTIQTKIRDAIIDEDICINLEA